jgi:hypothetical protein
MASTDYLERYNRALGKKLCTIAGLDPDTVSEGFNAESSGDGQVMVTLHVPLFMSSADYSRLSFEAQEKAVADEDGN